MIADERRAVELNLLRENGYIQVTDLAEEMNISTATIRRDLIELEEEGLCIRKRGGAVRSTSGVKLELPYDVKKLHQTEEKKKIALKALDFIENGDTILLDAGSTIYSLASFLGTKEQLTVVTNDLNIAVKLAANPKINLICTGGISRANVFTLQGPDTIDFIRKLTVDKAFIGADAIHADGIISNVNIEEVPIKQAMIEQAKQSYLLSDSSKYGKTGFAKVCDVGDLDFLITDENIPSEFIDLCMDKRVKVVI